MKVVENIVKFWFAARRPSGIMAFNGHGEDGPRAVNAEADAAWQRQAEEPEGQHTLEWRMRHEINEQQEKLAYWEKMKKQEERDRIIAQFIADGHDGNVIPPLAAVINGPAIAAPTNNPPANPAPMINLSAMPAPIVNVAILVKEQDKRQAAPPSPTRKSTRRTLRDIRLEVDRRTGESRIRTILPANNHGRRTGNNHGRRTGNNHGRRTGNNRSNKRSNVISAIQYFAFF